MRYVSIMINFFIHFTDLYFKMVNFVCVCVCVCLERERERELVFLISISANRSNSNEETNSFDELVFDRFVRYLKNYTHAV